MTLLTPIAIIRGYSCPFVANQFFKKLKAYDFRLRFLQGAVFLLKWGFIDLSLPDLPIVI
jgi:hypothetical protein